MSTSVTGRPPSPQIRSEQARQPKERKRGVRAWATRAPLLPALVLLIAVTQLPFVATLVISLFDWNSLSPDERDFAGFSNYTSVVTDPELRDSVFTTVLLTASVVVATVVLGLLLALLLDRSFFGRGMVRTLLITPFLIVPVSAALLWKHALYNPEYGLLNGALTWIGELFGDTSPPQPDWISGMPLIAVEAALVWQWTPFMMLILLAEMMEAARLDGAGSWQTFRYLTLPHLRRYLELGVLLGSVYIVQNFDAVFTITAGGLDTANLPYTIYQTFYNAHEYGLASAAGVVVVIGTMIIATFALRVVSSLFREEANRA